MIRRISILICFTFIVHSFSFANLKNIGLGYHLGAPVSGYTVRYWATDSVGLQLIGYEHRRDAHYVFRSHGGARLLYSWNRSTKKENEPALYVALGQGNIFSQENIYNYETKTTRTPVSEVAYAILYFWFDMFSLLFTGNTLVKTDSHGQKYITEYNTYLDSIDNSIEQTQYTELSIGLEQKLAEYFYCNLEFGLQRAARKRTINGDEHDIEFKDSGVLSFGTLLYF